LSGRFISRKRNNAFTQCIIKFIFAIRAVNARIYTDFKIDLTNTCKKKSIKNYETNIHHVGSSQIPGEWLPKYEVSLENEISLCAFHVLTLDPKHLLLATVRD